VGYRRHWAVLFFSIFFFVLFSPFFFLPLFFFFFFFFFRFFCSQVAAPALGRWLGLFVATKTTPLNTYSVSSFGIGPAKGVDEEIEYIWRGRWSSFGRAGF